MSDPTDLNRLHDIVSPDPVPWWPPAPGWYGVIALLAILSVAALLWAFLHRQRNAYRREALAECRRLSLEIDDPSTRLASLAGLAVLLKRVALTAFPRADVASLTGSSWCDFLSQTMKRPGFAAEAGALLERAAYGTVTDAELDAPKAHEAAAAVQRWIVHHQTEPGK